MIANKIRAQKNLVSTNFVLFGMNVKIVKIMKFIDFHEIFKFRVVYSRKPKYTQFWTAYNLP